MQTEYMAIYVPYLDSSSSESSSSLWALNPFDLLSPLPEWQSHVSETPKILPDLETSTESLSTAEVEELSRDAWQEEAPSLSLSQVDNEDEDDNQVAIRNDNGNRCGLNSSSYLVMQPARKRQRIGVGKHKLIGPRLS